MSAYATSFLLPPTSSAAECKSDTKLSNIGGESSSSSQEPSVPTSLPLHLSDDEKPVSLSTTSDSNAQPAKSCMRSRVPEILISVKSASVDPAGFVRAITNTEGVGRKRPLRRAGARPTSNDEPKNIETSEIGDQTHRPPISPKSDKPRLRFTDRNFDIRNSHRHKSSSSSCSSSTSSLHSHPEDAIRFELSISYAGRKYSATRTLNRLVRLRQDLMREIEDRRPGIVVPKRGDEHFHRQSLTDDDTDVTASISFDSDQYPRNASCTLNQNTPPPVVMIPELPVAGSETPNDDGSASRPHKDHRGLPTPSTTIEGGIGAAGSLVSGSFTRLHMALVQYCPAVENWFHRILTDILPDPESSPSLIAFLWEPLGAGEDDAKSGGQNSTSTTSGAGKHSKKEMGNKRHSSTRSICTLGSIDEQNCDEEDGEE